MSIGSWLGLPRVVIFNVPSTQTLIAFALIAAMWQIMVSGTKGIDPDIVDLVSNLLTLIVGYYFAKASDRADSARDAMLLSAGTGTGTPPPEPGTATIVAAADVTVDADVTTKPPEG